MGARTPGHRGASCAAVGLAVIGGACGSAPSTLQTRGENAQQIAVLTWLLLALGAAVYVGVMAVLAVALLRRRRQDASRGRPRTLLVGGGVILPVVVIVILTVATVATMRSSAQPANEPLRVEVTGFQWWWGVEYPASGITIANELRIPVDRDVEVTLESDNVIHSFWVPPLAGKVDLIPGRTNRLRFRAAEPGEYRGVCAEFCGLQHARMAFIVVAMEAAEFDGWVSARSAALESRRNAPPDPGLDAFIGAGCGRCHTIAGTPADGRDGPDLTHIADRHTIAAGTARNEPGQLTKWIADPASIKPGAKMPRFADKLTPEQIATIVAYLETLE